MNARGEIALDGINCASARSASFRNRSQPAKKLHGQFRLTLRFDIAGWHKPRIMTLP
jgi:hypothetical protein